MTDHETLRDAFTELERRADLHPEATTSGRGRSRPVLMAASVVAVLALAVAITVLAARGTSSHNRAGGASAPAPSDSGSGAVIVEPTPSNATLSPTNSPTNSPANSPTSTPSSASEIPASPQDLADEFRPVLRQVAGDSATLTVTDYADEPGDPAIVGTLTVGGVTGGFDFQILRTDKGSTAWCDTDSSSCSVRRLPDGSSLAIAHEPLQGAANGVTYQANLIRADGLEILMHVSNERDPKGESAVLAPDPVLTSDQMTAIVTSSRW